MFRKMCLLNQLVRDLLEESPRKVRRRLSCLLFSSLLGVDVLFLVLFWFCWGSVGRGGKCRLLFLFPCWQGKHGHEPAPLWHLCALPDRVDARLDGISDSVFFYPPVFFLVCFVCFWACFCSGLVWQVPTSGANGA